MALALHGKPKLQTWKRPSTSLTRWEGQAVREQRPACMSRGLTSVYT